MLRSRPLLSASIMMAAVVGALLYHLGTKGIFACDGSPDGSGRYLAYCNAVSYLNYDQGAFWFELEPEAYDDARTADVLFVGNSRLQFALSTPETTRWFQQRDISHYLFGFAHSETVRFFEPVIARMQPRARAMVIHVDRLFEDRLTPPMQQITGDPGARRAFRTKRLWQPVHSLACSAAPVLCGEELAFHRSIDSGHWLLTGSHGLPDEPVPVSTGPPVESERWSERGERARRFIDGLTVPRRCVFLMLIPYEHTRLDEARAIAEHVDMPLIRPEVSGLTTFDHSHLDPPSAARWSAAFFRAAGSKIERCVTGSDEPGDHG